MYKVHYNEQGRILGYYADGIEYKTIPEPYIEITEEQRQAMYKAERGKEWAIIDGIPVQRDSVPYELDTKAKSTRLKNELNRVLQDIEQEKLGIIRSDYVEKKRRAAEIINELRVLEGKTPRELETEESLKSKYDLLVEKFNALASAHNELAEIVAAIKENY